MAAWSTKRSKPSSSSRRAKPGAQKRSRTAAIDRPFAPLILDRARKIANEYSITIRWESDSGFVGEAVELPPNIGVGDTVDECVRETRDILTTTIAYMLEKGQRPPAPASEGKREVQLNIRLTADERLRLEEAARQAGFRSIADFVRTAALSKSA